MATPTEIFHRLLTGITEGRFAELADLYAEDAVVELPFAQPQPARFVGREALRAHFNAPWPDGFTLTASAVVVRETDDPEVVVTSTTTPRWPHSRARRPAPDSRCSNNTATAPTPTRPSAARALSTGRGTGATTTGVGAVGCRGWAVAVHAAARISTRDTRYTNTSKPTTEPKATPVGERPNAPR
jgi:hypothetical protein